jgi:ParB-like chromosome segregation protein Spo0J
MEIQMLNPLELRDNERNFRKHPVNQLNAIRDSLAEFGWLEPIIYNQQTERLLNGHARVYIARKDGTPEIPVHVVNVDAKAERRILASLQRTNDLGLVDDRALQALLAEVSLESETAIPGWDDWQLAAMLDEAAEKDKERLKDLPFDLEATTQNRRGRQGRQADATPLTRMVQLYFTEELDEAFRGRVDALTERFATTTLTDTVYKCVELCYDEWLAGKEVEDE